MVENSPHQGEVQSLIDAGDVMALSHQWSQENTQTQKYIAENIFSLDEAEKTESLLLNLQDRFGMASKEEKINIAIALGNISARVPSTQPGSAEYLLDSFVKEEDGDVKTELMKGMVKKSGYMINNLTMSDINKRPSDPEFLKSFVRLANERCSVATDNNPQELRLAALEGLVTMAQVGSVASEVRDTLHTILSNKDTPKEVSRCASENLAYCADRNDQVMTNSLLELYDEVDLSLLPHKSKMSLANQLMRVANRQTYHLIERLLADSDPTVKTWAGLARDAYNNYENNIS